MSDILIFGTSAVADVFEKELKDENRVIGYINTRFRGIYKNFCNLVNRATDDKSGIRSVNWMKVLLHEEDYRRVR